MSHLDQPTEPDVRLISTPPGGIMTDEVGTITGPVEIWLDGPTAKVRYEGALDIYTVTGDPAGRTLEEVATILTTDPGLDECNNPKSTRL